MNTDFNASTQAALAILAKRYKQDDKLIDLRRTKYWELLAEIKIDRDAAIAFARQMISSTKTIERLFGVTLLGEICNPVESDEQEQADEIIGWLSGLLPEEKRISILVAIADALGYGFSKASEPALLELSTHKNVEVRWAATRSLGSVAASDASEAVTLRLIALSADKDPDIRDWATMHVGGLSEDSDRVRNTLVARLNDRHFDTRTEAMYALAERGDRRGIGPLKKRLADDRANDKDIEAAGVYGLPELLESLHDWKTPKALVAWARKRCSPDDVVRDSVDDEWLGEQWYVDVQNGVRRPIKFKEWNGVGSPWDDDMEELAKSWVRYHQKQTTNIDDPDLDSLEQLSDLVREDPDMALRVMNVITKETSDQAILASLGAGPLEDIICGPHGPELFQDISNRVYADEKWRFAFGCVWTSGIDDPKFAKQVEDSITRYFPDGRP